MNYDTPPYGTVFNRDSSFAKWMAALPPFFGSSIALDAVHEAQLHSIGVIVL
jgi:hypothetical protein